jgi:hypothetical protein
MMAADREGLQAVEQAHAIAQEYEQNWVDFFYDVIRMLLYVHGGEEAKAASLLDKLGSALNEERATEVMLYNLGRCMLAQLRGDTGLAAHFAVCLDAAKETGGAYFSILGPA